MALTVEICGIAKVLKIKSLWLCLMQLTNPVSENTHYCFLYGFTGRGILYFIEINFVKT